MKKIKRPKANRKASVPASRFDVPVENLRWRCTPREWGITSLDHVEPVRETIGQDRALRALRVGLEMHHEGYNTFVTGHPGTGRTTTIKHLLQEFESQPATLTDKCYVHNFRDSDSPMLIPVPVGQGAALKKDMSSLLNDLLRAIPAAFESRRYQEERKAMLEHFQDRQRTVLKDLERRVREKGFEVVQVQAGTAVRPEIAPLVDGNPAGMDQLQTKVVTGEMTQEEMDRIIAQQQELERQLDLVVREMRNIERKAKKSTETLNQKIIVPIVEELFYDIETKHSGERTGEYFRMVKQHVVENLQRFHVHEEQQTSVLGIPVQKEEDPFMEFQVNVVVDNSGVKGMPVIVETNPRFKNLFGTIERMVDRNGNWRTDFMHIKAGSLLKADGGFLVVNAMDALVEPGVWMTLKRTLRNRQLEIQPPESSLFGVYSALKPEPIDLDVKVIMIGDASVYHLLYDYDDDFKKIFKIRADFDVEMPRGDSSVSSYISFIKSICDRDKLRTFDVSGVAEVLEYGSRLAGGQKKLSTRFNIIADVLREANYWAGKEQVPVVTGAHVQKAVNERIERLKLIEEKIQEMILDGSLLIDTEGSKIGQINGLSVYETGDYSFGKPTRITAKTSMGRGGIINIEREADMSGPSHNKGVLILAGYLRDVYAQHKPLVLSASLAFEQSYSGVDGDSASSTEVYALLSSLSGVPLRQDIAVTGSVNQHGEIQPIGGVNQKIEGFFDVCRARGLKGKEGVIIPRQNVKDLMLRHDVVDAVSHGKFHVYAIKHIDEGIELLTGRPAGKRLPNGRFTPGSIHALADKKLLQYAKKVKKFG